MTPVRIGPTQTQAAGPATARAINDRLALDLLLRHGPLTAAQLRQLTGLSRPTISDLLARLRDAGLGGPAGQSDAVRRGPNARVYELVADRAHVAGIDVRTVGVSLVVADLAGTVVAAADLGVADDEQETVGAVVDGLAGALRRAGGVTPHTIAIGAPGLIDPATGELRASSGLPRWHADLVAALRRRLNAAVILENEVNLAALAEQRQGAVHSFVIGIVNPARAQEWQRLAQVIFGTR